MADEGALSNVVKAVCPLHNDIDNLFAFKQETIVAIKSLYDKCHYYKALENNQGLR